jgi:hypothetical protein
MEWLFLLNFAQSGSSFIRVRTSVRHRAKTKGDDLSFRAFFFSAYLADL